MARSFRMYGKKRGHRRSGSQALASLGEALFFGFFVLLGSVALVLLLRRLVFPEWRVNHEFVEGTARVVARRVGEAVESGAKVYRPEILIRYQVADREYESWTYDITGDYSSGREAKQEIIESFTEGQEIACWHDPVNPAVAVVVRRYTWWLWLLLLLPVAFIVIGGGRLAYTLIHWGKSGERRAASRQLAARLDLFDETPPPETVYPTIPLDSNVTNSPGTHLRYRLPINTSPGWRLFAASAICLLWNGIVAAFLVPVIRGHAAGTPDWILTAFILPLAAIGVAIVFYLARQLLIVTGVGPTQLEISGHPLEPGRRYQVHLSQAGRMAMSSLEVLLACEEQASYHQGTDSRTDRRTVFEEQLFERRQFEVAPGRPFEERFELEVPGGAMHSFKAEHNEVQWKLLVRGQPAGRPGFERSFPIVVNPRSPASTVQTHERTPDQHSAR